MGVSTSDDVDQPPHLFSMYDKSSMFSKGPQTSYEASEGSDHIAWICMLILAFLIANVQQQQKKRLFMAQINIQEYICSIKTVQGSDICMKVLILFIYFFFFGFEFYIFLQNISPKSSWLTTVMMVVEVHKDPIRKLLTI